MESAAALDDDPRWPILRAGFDDLRLDCAAAQARALLRYLDLLARWNRHFNLTAVRDPARMVTLHLLDCLAALPSVDRRLQGRSARIVDVGSGAGLPGLVWALMRPAWTVTCVDAVAKKAGFVRQAAGDLGLPNLRAEHERVERFRLPGGADLVVCRAFAALDAFVLCTRQLLDSQGCWLAMKGAVPNDEIHALPTDIDVFHVEQLVVPGLEAQRCLVWMRPFASEVG